MIHNLRRIAVSSSIRNQRGSAYTAGTNLGDPIELAAATAVLLGRPSQASNAVPLTLAAGKSSIGHTEPAAGLAGIFQALQAMQSCITRPILHFRQVVINNMAAVTNSCLESAFVAFSCTLEEVYKLTEEAVHALNTFLLHMLTSHRTYCMQETIGLLTLCFVTYTCNLIQLEVHLRVCLLTCTLICHTAIEIMLKYDSSCECS